MEYILPPRVAEILQIKVSSVTRMARNSQLPAVKLGNLWRFDEAKILRYIERKYSNNYSD
jgi:excisionase family DNA binding protein